MSYRPTEKTEYKKLKEILSDSWHEIMGIWIHGDGSSATEEQIKEMEEMAGALYSKVLAYKSINRIDEYSIDEY